MVHPSHDGQSDQTADEPDGESFEEIRPQASPAAIAEVSRQFQASLRSKAVNGNIVAFDLLIVVLQKIVEEHGMLVVLCEYDRSLSGNIPRGQLLTVLTLQDGVNGPPLDRQQR